MSWLNLFEEEGDNMSFSIDVQKTLDFENEVIETLEISSDYSENEVIETLDFEKRFYLKNGNCSRLMRIREGQSDEIRIQS